MSKIKIFVCCHKRTDIPSHPLLVPIQVGAALADEHFSGFIHDDQGDNISKKNRSYCELTAQYWAWKNAEADYYGFFHYRRILYPGFKVKRPYRIERNFSEETLTKLNYDHFGSLIEQYDILVPLPENMYLSVRQHYAGAPFHHGKDLALLEGIIKDSYPAYSEAIEEYLSGNTIYFGNMFIMRHQVFDEYCTWLFSILEQFDKCIDTNGYSSQELRVDGYLAERMLGIYLTHALKLEKLKCALLPKVEFENSPLVYWKRKTVNFLLPPGSLRRARIKQLKNIFHSSFKVV